MRIATGRLTCRSTVTGWAFVLLASGAAGLSAWEHSLTRPKADPAAVTPFDPTGRWVMTLPAGWQRKVTISRAAEDTYHFHGASQLLLNGVYEINGAVNRLYLIEANDPQQIAFEWQILNANTLQLIRQETPSGGNYVGATLSRDFEWDRLEDGSCSERVGTLSHRRRD